MVLELSSFQLEGCTTLRPARGGAPQPLARPPRPPPEHGRPTSPPRPGSSPARSRPTSPCSTPTTPRWPGWRCLRGSSAFSLKDAARRGAPRGRNAGARRRAPASRGPGSACSAITTSRMLWPPRSPRAVSASRAPRSRPVWAASRDCRTDTGSSPRAEASAGLTTRRAPTSAPPRRASPAIRPAPSTSSSAGSARDRTSETSGRATEGRLAGIYLIGEAAEEIAEALDGVAPIERLRHARRGRPPSRRPRAPRRHRSALPGVRIVRPVQGLRPPGRRVRPSGPRRRGRRVMPRTRQIDHTLLAVTVGAAAVGVVFVGSASGPLAREYYHVSEYEFAIRQLIAVVLGLGVHARRHIRPSRSPDPVEGRLPASGDHVGGPRRRLRPVAGRRNPPLAPASRISSIQPSAVAKVTLPLALAALLGRSFPDRRERVTAQRRAVLHHRRHRRPRADRARHGLGAAPARGGGQRPAAGRRSDAAPRWGWRARRPWSSLSSPCSGRTGSSDSARSSATPATRSSSR